MKKLLFALISCCFSTSLFAGNITNQELLKSCKNQSTGTQNFCYGFIIASANAAQFYRNIVDTEGEYIDICFPETASNKDMVDLYIAWAEKNTTAAGDAAFIGVSSSFSTKFSCAAKESDTTKKVVLSPPTVPHASPVSVPRPSTPVVAQPPHPAPPPASKNKK